MDQPGDRQGRGVCIAPTRAIGFLTVKGREPVSLRGAPGVRT
jgi:hypothetical protein